LCGCAALVGLMFGAILFLPGFLQKPRSAENPSFDEIIGGVFGGRVPDVDLFSSTMANLVSGEKDLYLDNLKNLKNKMDLQPLSDVIVQGKRGGKMPYRGIYINDIRDARWVLANIDKVKAAGIDTLLLEVQYWVKKEEPNRIYVPGEETYLFYLNAFNKSGFRIWLTLGHTAYQFPYAAWSDQEYTGMEPLEDQTYLLELVKPQIYKWASVAQQFNVDTFIPAEEANTMILTRGYEKTDLCFERRQTINEWMQEILPEIKKNFSGKVGFATNQGARCTEDDPGLEGPDFNYEGYDFIVRKIPFPSVFEMLPNNNWDNYIEITTKDTIKMLSRDGAEGIIYYEAGDTVGKALREDFAGSLAIRENDEEHQKVSYEKELALLGQYSQILGLFFKISDVQPHEPSWNPFGRPAEETLKDSWAKKEALKITETDKIWLAIGQEGLKAIQICLSEEMPFDPEYELDYELTGGEYGALISKIRPLCQ